MGWRRRECPARRASASVRAPPGSSLRWSDVACKPHAPDAQPLNASATPFSLRRCHISSETRGIPTPSSILFSALQGTGEVYSALEMGPEALKSFQKAQEILLGMGLNGVDETCIASSYGSIGTAYDIMGQYDAAMEHLQKSLEIQVIFGN